MTISASFLFNLAYLVSCLLSGQIRLLILGEEGSTIVCTLMRGGGDKMNNVQYKVGLIDFISLFQISQAQMHPNDSQAILLSAFSAKYQYQNIQNLTMVIHRSVCKERHISWQQCVWQFREQRKNKPDIYTASILFWHKEDQDSIQLKAAPLDWQNITKSSGRCCFQSSSVWVVATAVCWAGFARKRGFDFQAGLHGFPRHIKSLGLPK